MDGAVPAIALLLLLGFVALGVALLFPTFALLSSKPPRKRRWHMFAAICAALALPLFGLSATVSRTGIGEVPVYISLGLALWGIVLAGALWPRERTGEI